MRFQYVAEEQLYTLEIYFGSNDFVQSRGRSADFGFDLSSNIFLITSFMLLPHVKPCTEHTYSSILEKTSCDIFPSPNLLNALVNFSFFNCYLHRFNFPLSKKRKCAIIPKESNKLGSEEIF